MFVEKLNQSDYIEFLNNLDKENKGFDVNSVTNFKLENEKVTFDINDIHYTFTDFDYIDSDMQMIFYNINNIQWLNFMFDKFGLLYKTAFNNYNKARKSNKNNQSSQEEDVFSK